MNLLEVIQPWIIVKYRMWKLNKAFSKDFPGKPVSKEDQNI